MTKLRCNSCNKKIGLHSYECKCDGIYCTQCRYPDIHNCSYDFIKEKKEILNKQNPQIKSKQIVLI